MLRKIIEDTTQILDQARVRISHCYKETNQAADALAKHATTLMNANLFYSFQQLPFQFDKWQLPCIRNRFDKANFFVS